MKEGGSEFYKECNIFKIYYSVQVKYTQQDIISVKKLKHASAPDNVYATTSKICNTCANLNMKVTCYL